MILWQKPIRKNIPNYINKKNQFFEIKRPFYQLKKIYYICNKLTKQNAKLCYI